ncbi:MAG: DUF72 domain-containing protein [Armatimonadetes bacterium]|nr:DUF72 domain-containing protein [Armatimonadota bacterium]
MVHIGTSGFSYEDWVGKWYPSGLKKADMLRYYARRFNALEVNFTYYRMPSARTLQQMSAKTGETFRFVVKANSEMTHERTAEPEVFRVFQEALGPLIDEGKLGCLLAQFPNSFKPEEESLRYLQYFREQTPELPVVVEFRNRGWLTADTFDLLEALDLGYCCVDEPQLKGLLPPVAVRTSDLGYVRFHGRNAGQWYGHEEAWQRYNYLYSEEELREWVDKVRAVAEGSGETFVFFNNHYQGQAAINAEMFAGLLELPLGDSAAGGLLGTDRA